MSKAKIVRIGEAPPTPESGQPANILAGNPTTTTQNYYTDAGQQFFSGIWESTRGKWAVDYVEEEFCALVRGKVILTDQDGEAQTFEEGDAFIIPVVFKGTWETVEPVRKLYVIYEPSRR
jgi:uncharacterized cupin superfamily protein